MATPYKGPVLEAPPADRKPYAGPVLTAPPNEKYQPTILPFRYVRGQGFEGAMPQILKEIWGGIEAPGRVLRGDIPPVPETLIPAAAQTAATITTGGLATPRVIIPAGVAAMNAVGPPIRATAKATGRAISSVAAPIIDRIDREGGIGRSLLRRVMQDNPGLSADDAIAQVEDQLKRLGAPSMLADTGKSAQKLARNMAQGPGQTAQLAEKNLGGRSASQGSRLVGSVKENISPKNFHEELAAIETRQQELAGPLYREAFDANKDIWSNEIGRILETDAGREAFETARSRMSNRMKKLGVPDAELTAQMKELVGAGKMDPVKGGVSKGFKLEFLDLIKQDLGEQEQRLKRAYIGGNAKKGQVAEVGDLRRDLTRELDRLDATAKTGPNSVRADGGAYSRARRVYSDDASLQDAMEQGRGFVKGDQEVTEKLFRGLTDSQKEAFRIGVAREMAGMILNTGMLPAALRNVLQDNTIKARLRFLAPDETSFGKLIGDIEREITFQKTSNAVRGGSPTGSIFMEEGQIAQDALDTTRQIGGAAVDIGQGRLASAGMRFVDWGLTQLSRMRMPQDMRDRIGRLLISPEQADKEEALRLMRAVSAQFGDLPKPPAGLGSKGGAGAAGLPKPPRL